MNNSHIRLPEINNPICEAIGCYSEAINNIAMKVGSKGSIILFLCDKCKLKFCEDLADHNQSNLEMTSR